MNAEKQCDEASATADTKNALQCYRTSLVRFCGPLWDNFGIKWVSNIGLKKYQNRAVRVITKATYDTGSSVLLEDLNCKSLEERQKYLKSIFIPRILNGYIASNLKDAFCFNNERDGTCNLRNRETDFLCR